MKLLDKIKERIVLLDGGIGTLLQSRGLAAGELPESWNVTHPQEIERVHEAYVRAGSDCILTNTFGANSLKFHEEGRTVADIVRAAVGCARKGAEQAGKPETAVALDIGPTGRLLKPMGDLAFEDAVTLFSEICRAGKEAGVDLIYIETMNDLYELKAAVLAAKESTELPVFATVTFDERKKLLTGGDVPAVVALLEGLGVDALGCNCGLGPVQMQPAVEELLRYASVPVIVKPNAGLPRSENGQTVYDMGPETFAQAVHTLAEKGALLIGGCCGTTPEHLRRTAAACANVVPVPLTQKTDTLVCAYAGAVEIGGQPVIIGERINPTGKSKMKAALRENNMEYLLREGLMQQEKGAHVLDVNVGLPEIDEPEMLARAVQEIQSVVDLPLQLDTADPVAMERALRLYNGKALVNSVSGKQESMETVFPLVKKYGGVVVGLTLDEDGIPPTAQGRFQIAENIVRTAGQYGIAPKDIIIDVLTMTVSAEPQSALVTLDALRRVRERLHVKTVLGVSNISFGLPQRPVVNGHFYAMALAAGLDAAILNPASDEMMAAYYAYGALSGKDANCARYIARFGAEQTDAPATAQKGSGDMTLSAAIEKGLRDDARRLAQMKLQDTPPLQLIDSELIPALDRVGKGFEKGTLFLPQLLMSAEAAKGAFEAVRTALRQQGGGPQGGKIVLATVQGDIHDIGKNIVKVLLENYGFQVIDLGRDVAPQMIVDTVQAENAHLVGLSALMTTTVVSMEATIRLLREHAPDCRIMVGGAVLTKDYAERIGADQYCHDAMQSVHYAQKAL